MTREMTILAERLPEYRILGLRAGWLNGESDELEFDLDSGAGFGNASLSMSVRFKDNESRVTETVDMRKVATMWANALLAEHREAQRGLD